MSTQKDDLHGNINPKQTGEPANEISCPKIFINQLPPEKIKAALLQDGPWMNPMEELIFIATATFEFIRNSKLDRQFKNAFYQLERQFEFYRNLLGR